ncbi:MAG: aspartate-semialdehyde dehydrogenase, partial [Candidatus Magasanikbacteria bacterium]|nr:aspartate-semialdehyde dehydrogenase [Candidatus Magasanikbacteria bacterium]
VGIIGATGMVGQRYITLLQGHPWFQVTCVAASANSAGVSYAQSVKGRWHMSESIPKEVGRLTVLDAANVQEIAAACDFVFSAVEMPDKEKVKQLEESLAAAGLPVISNASAHRWTPDVPMLLPEINSDHTKMIDVQRKNRGWSKGFIAVKPNCSIQTFLTPIYALRQAGYEIDRLSIVTMQAISGAGYPGVPSLDMVDNIVPFIGGEEEKTETEPLKILGELKKDKFVLSDDLIITAACNRVPVSDGHTACVSMSFKKKKPTHEEIIAIWKSFSSVPQELDLPMAPAQAILYLEDQNRPQPKKDRDSEKGMAVSVGRLRECPLLDFKFVALSHNTIRGAAGGGILNAELLFKQGYIEA